MNESHLAFESGIVFPHARELKDGEGPDALADMGAEMALRRGARPLRR